MSENLKKVSMAKVERMLGFQETDLPPLPGGYRSFVIIGSSLVQSRKTGYTSYKSTIIPIIRPLLMLLVRDLAVIRPVLGFNGETDETSNYDRDEDCIIFSEIDQRL